MKILILVFIFIVYIYHVDSGRNKKKVLVKIHVPKILKHHHHTKLVLLHRRPQAPKIPVHHIHRHPPYKFSPFNDHSKVPITVKKPEVVHHHHVHHYHHNNNNINKNNLPKLFIPANHKVHKYVHRNHGYHGFQHQYGTQQHAPISDYKDDFPSDVILGYDKDQDKLTHKSLRSEKLEVETFDDKPDYSGGYQVKEDPFGEEQDKYDDAGGNFDDDVEMVDDYNSKSGKYLDISFEERSIRNGHDDFEGV